MHLDRLIELKDDAVRALAWSIGSPSLMSEVNSVSLPHSDFFEGELDASWSWLLALDEDPSPLHAHLRESASSKVGLYFESLLTWWLRWHPHYILLAHNLQVHDGKRTMGAFDFLLRDQRGQALHWEVAVKFYLQHRDRDDWTAWVGPNQRDRLDIKLDRMRAHQLPLSARPQAASALASVGIVGVPKQVALLKGVFFEPWNRPGARPMGSSSEAAVGQWIRASDVASLTSSEDACRWCERHKPDWLGPARRTLRQSQSHAELVERLAASKLQRPQLWSRLRRRGEGVWFEDQRLFVVPDAWSQSG